MNRSPASAAVFMVVGGLGLGLAAGWNIANTGAIAGVLDDAYGVDLPAVGLLTTALFLTHFAVQVPGGRLIDTFGARRLGLAAIATIVVANAVAVAAPSFALGLGARALMGFGTGAAFVAGSDAVRAGGGTPAIQGVYGGISVAGGGLAIALVPLLEHVLSWRAPYVAAIVLALAVVPLLTAAPGARHAGVASGGAKASVVRDRRLYRLGVVHTATFGLAVVLGNWIATLLEDEGFGRNAAGAVGAFVLLGGLITRPLGGWLMFALPERIDRLVLGSLAASALGAFGLASGAPPAVLAASAVLVGLAAGIPFAVAFSGAQRLRSDAPAAAIGVVNGLATLAIVTGTPLLGLTFSLPGGGRLGFAAAGALMVGALVVVARGGSGGTRTAEVL